MLCSPGTIRIRPLVERIVLEDDFLNNVFVFVHVAPLFHVFFDQIWNMVLGLASVPGLASTKPHCMLSTAWVSSHVRPKYIEEGLLLMVHTMIKLRCGEGISTCLAFIDLQPCPELPKDSAPADSVLFQELNEPLQIPVGVWLMLSYLSPIDIDQNCILLRIRTPHPAELAVGVKLIAVNAKVKSIVLFTYQIIKLVHKYF